MFKTVFLSLTSIASTIINPILLNSNNHVLQIQESKDLVSTDSKIIDFNKLMTDAFITAYKYIYPVNFKQFVDIKSLSFLNQKESNINASLVGDPFLESYDKKIIYTTHEILKNNLDQETMLSTQSYNVKLLNVIGSSTNLGISLDLTPQILNVFGFKTKFLFNSTNITKNFTNEIVTFPSQNISVPAQHQIQVNSSWTQSKMVQKVALNVDISGTLQGVIILKNQTQEFEISYSDAIFYLQLDKQCPEEITINSDNQSIHFNGEAQSWESDGGGEYNVEIMAPQLIDSNKSE